MFMFLGATCCVLQPHDRSLLNCWCVHGPSVSSCDDTSEDGERLCIVALNKADKVHVKRTVCPQCMTSVCPHLLSMSVDTYWKGLLTLVVYTQITAQRLCSRDSTEQRGTLCLKGEGTALTKLTGNLFVLCDVTGVREWLLSTLIGQNWCNLQSEVVVSFCL